MSFFHLTLRRNTPSIRLHGLQGELSRGKMLVVWIGTARYCRGIWEHVARQHGVSPHQIVAFEVHVPRAWRKRKWRGVWFSIINIPPCHVGRRFNWQEVSNASSLLRHLD